MNEMKEKNPGKLVFIGAGNMAEAMIRGILKTGIYRNDDIIVADIDSGRLEYFQRELGITGSSDNKQAASTAKVIVLAVKPQQADAVLHELTGKLPDNILLISIVTGFTTEKIMAALGEAPRGKPRGIFAEPCEAKDAMPPCGKPQGFAYSAEAKPLAAKAGLAKKGQPARIIRVVPNTPALVGSGASAYCCGRGTTDEDAHLAESILKSIGIAIQLEEPLMNAVTALSGSGPAYVFYLVEALLKAGREIGLTEEDARKLVMATVTGSAHILLETGLQPDELRRRVTSRGGTTEAAMEILNKKGTQQTIIAAVKAAHKRAKELSA